MAITRLSKAQHHKLKAFNHKVEVISFLENQYEVPARIKLYSQKEVYRWQLRMTINGKPISKSAFIKDKSSKKHNRTLIGNLADELISFLSENSATRTTCKRVAPVSSTFVDGKVKLQLTLWGASKSTNHKAKNICYFVKPNTPQTELNLISERINRLWSWRIDNARPNFDMNTLTIPSDPKLSSEISPYELTESSIASLCKEHLKTTASVITSTIGNYDSCIEKDLISELIAHSEKDVFWTFDRRSRAQITQMVAPSCRFYEEGSIIYFSSDAFANNGAVALGLERKPVTFAINDTNDLERCVAIIASKLLIAKLSTSEQDKYICLVQLFEKGVEVVCDQLGSIIGEHGAISLINMRKAIEFAIPEAKYFKQDTLIPSRIRSPKLNLISEKVSHYSLLIKAINMVNDGVGRIKIPIRLSDLETFKNGNETFYSDMIVFTNLDRRCRQKQNFEGLYPYVNMTTPKLEQLKPTICHYCKSEPVVYHESCESSSTTLYSIHCNNGCHTKSYSVEGTSADAADVAVRWTIANLSYYNPIFFKFHSVDCVRAKEGVDAAIRHLKALEAYLVTQNALFSLHQKYGSVRAEEILMLNSDKSDYKPFIPTEHLIAASKLNLKWAKMNVDLI